MNNLFICYPKCSTCKKAESWLKLNNISFEYKNMKEDNPTKEELRRFFDKSGLPLRRFFNTSGLKYRELNLKDKLENMSEDEQLALLGTDGMLVKRPIFVGENNVFVGFKENEWESLL